jgi:hypothetical protein
MSQLTIEQGKKLSNATWLAKAQIQPSGEVLMAASDEELAPVEVYWYPDGEIKVILKGGGPAAIEQFYRDKDKVIAKFVPRD